MSSSPLSYTATNFVTIERICVPTKKNKRICVLSQGINSLNLPIGLSLADKIKLLRKREALTQQAFCDLIGVKKSTISSFESGSRETMTSDTLMKIANHSRFLPYAMWLIVDQLSEEQQDDILNYLKTVRDEDIPDE